MNKEKKYTEINIPSFDKIIGAFKKKRNTKEPEDTVIIKKYKITEKELKNDYNIKGEIQEIKVKENNIEITTMEK